MNPIQNTLFARNAEDGWLVAYRLYEFGVLNNLYSENDRTAQTIALYFQTVAQANNFWRNLPVDTHYHER